LERIDAPAPSAGSVVFGAEADHYQVTHAAAIIAAGANTIDEDDMLPLAVDLMAAKTTQSNLLTIITDLGVPYQKRLNFPRNGTYQVAWKMTDRQVVGGQTTEFSVDNMKNGMLLTAHGGSSFVDMWYDNSTGTCGGTRASGGIGMWSPGANGATTQFGGMAVATIDVTDYISGYLRFEASNMYTFTVSSVGTPTQIAMGYDIVVSELPAGFARKKSKTLEERLKEMEERMIKADLRDCKDSKDVKSSLAQSLAEIEAKRAFNFRLAPGMNKGAGETEEARLVRKQRELRGVMNGTISPTDSLAGWVDSSLAAKLGQVKDQKDEKDRKGKG